jgi:uncharacterized protein (TIGR01777 family)
MTIVMAGGSGFLGRALANGLTGAGHDVVVLTRRETGMSGPPNHVRWTPDGSVGPWASAIDGAHAVVNLAGESIAAGRWTDARKRSILQSRLRATRSLVGAIASARRPPAVLVSASAQGYYGDHGDEQVTEESAPGTDFMADVCVQWEAEALKAADLTRVVLLRTGLVLSASEGALPRMLLPFRLFGGGRLGTGRQYMSWIHWRDWAGIVRWLLDGAATRGPVNICTPAPVTNSEFSNTLGRVLRRPSWLPAPAFAIRTVVGEMADALLFTSIRMVPRRLLDLGYRYEFPALEGALKELLR